MEHDPPKIRAAEAYDPERSQHHSIPAERTLVAQDLINHPEYTQPTLRRFSSYLQQRLRIERVDSGELRLSTRLEFIKHQVNACVTALSALSFEGLLEDRITALRCGLALPLAENISLDEYQHQQALAEHPRPLATLLATLSQRLWEGIKTVHERIAQPSDRYFPLFTAYDQLAPLFNTVWNEREELRASRDPHYLPKLYNHIPVTDPGHILVQGSRDDLYLGLQCALPGFFALRRSGITDPHEQAKLALYNLDILSRPALVKLHNYPMTLSMLGDHPKKGTAELLLEEAERVMTLEPNGRLRWLSEHLQNEKGSWNNVAYYNLEDSEGDSADFPFSGCAAAFPVFFPSRELTAHYIQMLQNVYNTRITLCDATGRIGLSEILVAEVILTAEQTLLR